MLIPPSLIRSVSVLLIAVLLLGPPIVAETRKDDITSANILENSAEDRFVARDARGHLHGPRSPQEVLSAWEVLRVAGVLEDASRSSLLSDCDCRHATQASRSISGMHRVALEEDQNSEKEEHGGSEESSESPDFLYNGAMALLCVTLAALAAGLTMGMLSLDPLMLTIKLRASRDELERQQAKLLLPLVQQHHRLLVSLLLLNSISNEALPLFLDKIVPGYMAVILSVTLVLFFGEIIPSAIFTGPKQISIAASLVPLVRTIMLILSPVGYPVAKLLDFFLHDDDEANSMGLFDRGELGALVRIQYEERMATKKRRKIEMAQLAAGDSSTRSFDSLTMRGLKKSLSERRTVSETYQQDTKQGSSNRPTVARTSSWHRDEVTLVEGALSMKNKQAIDCYTPMRNVFALPSDMCLDEANIVNIYARGYSRVPIYVNYGGSTEDKDRICGILITKQLMVINKTDRRTLSTMPLLRPFCISPSTNLVDLINIFQEGRSSMLSGGGHLAFLCANPDKGNKAFAKGKPIPKSAGLMGIVTLEDVLEELLQEEIFDEQDRNEVESLKIARRSVLRWKRFVERKRKAHEKAPASLEPRMSFISIVSQAVAALSGGDEANGDSCSSDVESCRPDETFRLLDGRKESTIRRNY